MSLENAINDHAAAIRELAAAILASAHTPAAAPVGKLVDLNPEKPEAKAATQSKEELIKQAAAEGEAKLAAKKKAEADAAAKKKAEEDAAEELAGGGEESAPVLDYSKDVEHKFKAFLKGKGREPGLALLKKYGAASGSQVAPGKLAAFLADIEAA